MMTIARGAAVVLVAMGTLQCGGPRTSPPAAEVAVRNVVVISIDALRADHMSCYGYPRPTTPAIDTIADEGVLFERAFATASWTGPSLASFFSSTLPGEHLVSDFLAPGNRMAPGLVSLADAAAADGLGTAFFSGHGGLNAIRGLARGWQHFEDGESSAQQLAAEAGRWIGAQQGRFLAWVHMMEPHTPYDPGPDFAGLFLDPGADHGELRRRFPWQRERTWTLLEQGEELSPEERAFHISQYDACIREADAAVGSLMQELRARDLLRNTAVIITSDHGEGLGEHGYYFEHGDFLYEGLLHIPLVVRLPGDRNEASRRPDLVSAMDLAPTVASLLGLQAAAGWQGRPLLDGQSARELVVAQLPELRMASVRGERWKLVSQGTPGDPEAPETRTLFNLENDPDELRDVAAENPGVVQDLDAVLQVHSPDSAPNVAPQEVPDEVLERLRALGYVD